MKSFYYACLAISLQLLLHVKSNGQQIDNSFTKASIETQQTVRPVTYFIQPAGSKYKAGKWKALWWGHHYREEWITPVAFPYLDWKATKGGLVPLKLGGGHETKTLRVVAADGKEYVLRTMDKDLSLKVPDALKGSYANDVANDQISTAHPYGPVVISQLAAAAGLLHTNPLFYYVPLNEVDTTFNYLFAGKICMLEERPSGKGWQHTALTNYADKIVNTADMLDNIRSSNSCQVDQKAFLKVRLFDMWINDWDRHDDQWVWCAHTNSGKTVYEPFARDRDQAFSKTDGINLYFLSRPSAFRSLQNFTGKVRDVIGQNLSALSLDRQFLNSLSKDEWQRIAKELQESLTDFIIHTAVQAMPDTIVALSGKHLEQSLKQRRNNLLNDALRYYHYLTRQVDIVGTLQEDVFTIETISPDETILTVSAKEADGRLGSITYQRHFYAGETSRVTLYGLEEDDVFQLTGSTRSNIRINALGGNGQDQYLYRNAQKSKGKKMAVYEVANNPVYDSRILKNHSNQDTIFMNYDRRAFKPDWYRWTIVPAYNSDDGFILAGAYTYRKYGWKTTPFAWQQSLGVSYGFGSDGWIVNYAGNFTNLIGKAGLEILSIYKSPQTLFNYFGAGNETVLSKKRKSYYRVDGSSYSLEPSLTYNTKNAEYKFGAFYQVVKLDSADEHYINTQHGQLDRQLFSSLQYGGLQATYSFKKINDVLYPSNGFGWTANVQWIQQLTTRKDQLLKWNGAIVGYVPLGTLVVAHRTGGTTINTGYPFYLAPSLDGNNNTRGYWRNRFYGKTSFYQNTELRVKVKEARGYVLRGAVGLLAFFDDGRVWMKGESSSRWHTAYGGGLFFMPYNMTLFSCTYGVSNEARTVQLRMGFFF